MSIKTLALKNFTVFNDFKIDVSSGVNIFVGENGTGKTHLLKSIYTICELSKNLDFASIILQNIFSNSRMDSELLRDKKNLELKIALKIDEPTEYTKTACTSLDNSVKYSFVLPKNFVFSAIYVPVKDMLTHSNGFLAMSNAYQNFPFDKTLTDIVLQASRWKLKQPPKLALEILPVLEEMMGGEVVFENDEFFIKKSNGQKIIFEVEAEGLKKIGLLWQLIMTGSITEKSVLIWDEPESNLNPKFLPKLAECLILLAKNGVQIFLSTHNYIFAKYFDVLKKRDDKILFHSLFFDEKVDGVSCESKKYFAELERNDIADAFNQLLERVYNIEVGN